MWKDIKEYEGLYQVSDSGQVKSLSRHVENGSTGGMILKERLLKPCLCKNGYLYVVLSKNHIKKNYYIHRLVATAFLSETNSTVNHKDGNKHNNSLSNLEFVSYSENNQHAYNIGLHRKGEKHYLARLTQEQVNEIKKCGKTDTYEKIALNYGVNKATIRDILLGRTWK